MPESPDTLTNLLEVVTRAHDLEPGQLWLSLPEAAPILGYSDRTVRRRVREGETFGGAVEPPTAHRHRRVSLPALIRYCLDAGLPVTTETEGDTWDIEDYPTEKLAS